MLITIKYGKFRKSISQLYIQENKLNYLLVTIVVIEINLISLYLRLQVIITKFKY